MLTGTLTAGKVAAHLGLVVLGFLVGVAGSLVQSGWAPGGLLLALLGVAALCYGGAAVTGGRAGGAAGGIGWLLAVLLLSLNRPEGDFLFEAGVGSYVFMLGGMAIAVICATLAKKPQPGRPADRLDG
ncbi:hypothetical protein I5Q34_15415 [Streptomyces sp. AV19]|uniref:DUF6113 family protein n=1 Tax=Streptomyces sp. AV19 TaxID=2793068 RepID=UPI0018FE602E|nr:DUF6113 family protein [Streptomyces sp. AV19]MBH1935641.1 hypothetical protein [Streptomyces sp. AV19]MDG4536083.1 DUF6113 family protein [Streptomyces sp. AV19]